MRRFFLVFLLIGVIVLSLSLVYFKKVANYYDHRAYKTPTLHLKKVIQNLDFFGRAREMAPGDWKIVCSMENPGTANGKYNGVVTVVGFDGKPNTSRCIDCCTF